MAFALVISQAVRYITSSKSDFDDNGQTQWSSNGALPLIASPVDPKAYAWLHRKRRTEPPVPGQVKRSFTITQFESQHTDSKLAGRIFRNQHAVSSLELFFDLFFVANLAIFTENHAHIDAQSIGNYVGFFAMLWSTWFHTSIYEVRFYADCVFNRFCKLVIFAILVSFVSLGTVYDEIASNEESRAFRGLALVLMAFRFVLCIQYSVVLYYVHGFQKTLMPLLLTMLVYLASGIAFLSTYLIDINVSLSGTEGSAHVTRWYLIIRPEVLLVIIISSIWRVLSFKHTHLVERVGLLTLIVMGEGIIGLAKSVAYVMTGTNVSIWAETGLVATAVILIYFVYLLYFDSIEHDRFGSIRQQIWALSHFPPHVAIILTVEGQTALILWDAILRGQVWIHAEFPSITSTTAEYNSTNALIAAVNQTIADTAERFHYTSLFAYYNPASDIVALQNSNTTGPFGSREWNRTASEILLKIEQNLFYFLFVNFNAEGPEEEIDAAKDPRKKIMLYNNAFKVVFKYFYIGAGCLLIVLAIMLAFGKTKKRGDEYFSIFVRFLISMALPFISAVAFLEAEGDTSSFRFWGAGWIIAAVTLSYLFVLITDNTIQAIYQVTGRRNRRQSSGSSPTDEETGHYGLKPNPEAEEMRLRQIRFQQGHSHSESHDAETALTEGPPKSGRNSKGYSYLDQDDQNDEPHPAHEQEYTLQQGHNKAVSDHKKHSADLRECTDGEEYESLVQRGATIAGRE